MVQLKAKGILDDAPEEEELSISELTNKAKTAIKDAPKPKEAPKKAVAPTKVTIAAKTEADKNVTQAVAKTTKTDTTEDKDKPKEKTAV